jgi:hypothetical protein
MMARQNVFRRIWALVTAWFRLHEIAMDLANHADHQAKDARVELEKAREIIDNQSLLIISQEEAAAVLRREIDLKNKFLAMQFEAYGRQEREHFKLKTECNNLRRIAHEMIGFNVQMGYEDPPLSPQDCKLLETPSIQRTT